MHDFTTFHQIAQADIIKSMQIAQRLTTMSFSETITWASILEWASCCTGWCPRWSSRSVAKKKWLNCMFYGRYIFLLIGFIKQQTYLGGTIL